MFLDICVCNENVTKFNVFYAKTCERTIRLDMNMLLPADRYIIMTISTNAKKSIGCMDSFLDDYVTRKPC